MKKGLLLLGLALGLALLAASLARHRPPEEMLLEGKSVKDWALEAYSRDPKAEAALKSGGAKCLPGLLRLLRAHDSWSRRQMLKLSPLLPRGARVQFFKRLPISTAVRTREAAAHALGLLGLPYGGTIPALFRALHDPEGRVCWEAASALARIGKPALPVLVAALADKTPRMRHLGAFGLGELGPEAFETLPLLTGLLDDADRQVRTAAAESLVLIGTEAVMLTNGLALPPDPLGRKNALRIRLQLDRSLPAYVSPLTAMAGSPDPARRQRGIELLASAGGAGDAVVAAMIKGLNDDDPDVRLAACNGLARLGARARPGIPLLTSNLTNPGPALRRSSAAALGAIGPAAAEAIPQLELLCSDAEITVRSTATSALTRIQLQRP